MPHRVATLIYLSQNYLYYIRGDRSPLTVYNMCVSYLWPSSPTLSQGIHGHVFTGNSYKIVTEFKITILPSHCLGLQYSVQNYLEMQSVDPSKHGTLDLSWGNVGPSVKDCGPTINRHWLNVQC